MKHILSFIAVFALLFTSCTGPQGPPGFDGFDGIDGINGQDGGLIVASAFEIEVNFNADNNFQFTEPYGFEVLPSDVTLVYIEWETDAGAPIWRLLTQTEYFDNGILVYNYDFTQQDVNFFLDGTIDFNTLDDSWTQNQAFRVVVIPADNIDGLDTSDLNLIMNASSIQSFDMR